MLRADLLELERLRHGLEVVREAGFAEANGRAAEEVAHTHLAQLALSLQCIIRQTCFVKHLMYNVVLERYRLPSSIQKTPESRWPMHREKRTKAVFAMISSFDSLPPSCAQALCSLLLSWRSFINEPTLKDSATSIPPHSCDLLLSKNPRSAESVFNLHWKFQAFPHHQVGPFCSDAKGNKVPLLLNMAPKHAH